MKALSRAYALLQFYDHVVVGAGVFIQLGLLQSITLSNAAMHRKVGTTREPIPKSVLDKSYLASLYAKTSKARIMAHGELQDHYVIFL